MIDTVPWREHRDVTDRCEHYTQRRTPRSPQIRYEEQKRAARYREALSPERFQTLQNDRTAFAPARQVQSQLARVVALQTHKAKIRILLVNCIATVTLA